MSAPAEDQNQGNVAQKVNVSIDHALEKAVPGSSSSSGHGSRVGVGSCGGAIVQANTQAFHDFSLRVNGMNPEKDRDYKETSIKDTEKVIKRVMRGHLRLDQLQVRSGGAKFDTKTKAGAAACMEDIRANFTSTVLATVEAVAWRDAWLSGVILFLIDAVPVSSVITLLAVKGGPGGGSDCEVEFIKRVLPLMGAKPHEDYQEEGEKVGAPLTWTWNISRPGAGRCMVQLKQYEQPEDAYGLASDFLPDPAYAAAPDLQRVAMVSAPAETKGGESVTTLLNREVAGALEEAAARAAKKGWQPNSEDYTKADGNLDWDAYGAAMEASMAD